MDLNQTLTEIIKTIIVVGTPIAMWMAAKLWVWLCAWIDAHTQNQYLLRIAHEAEQVVAAMAQSMAGPIKEAAADGKLTDEEKQRIKSSAMDALRQRLMGYIPSALLTDTRLGQAIEASVSGTKPIEATMTGIRGNTENPQPAPVSQ